MKWFAGYLSESQVTYRKDALLRTADCHFMLKDYKAACQAYDVVLADYFNADDIYPYYQAALSYGLDKNMDKKIELLSNVRTASATAKFYPEALFELGRAYVSKYEDDKAFECFRTLADTVKDSTFVARAYIEMGSLSRNQSQYKDALAYYRTVVEEMPLSGYSEDALAAIEAIYQIKNEPEEYIAYIESIGKGGSKTDSEKEDMIFNSAEQIFLSENYQKALISLQSYLEKYPEGRNAYKADFYIAESYRHTGKYDQACDSYRSVIEHGEGSFVELSMLNFSELSYKLEKWEDAYGGYSSLYSAALIENNKYTALLGMMRSAYRWHNWNEAVKSAEKVIFDSRSDAGVKSEAQYVKAKSYLAMSRRDDALAILSKLAEDLSNPYGAEAAYMLIQDSYDKGDFEEVDITREAQMILSCVKRIHDKLGYHVGIAVIARVLQGSKGKKLLQLGLDDLSTYGLMKATGRTEIRAMADHLEGLGYLLTESEHQTVRLTPKASQVLYRGKPVQMLVQKEKEELVSPAAATKLSGDEADLYDLLRELRGKLAREANIPAYVVFSNATLQDMARKKPRTMMDFRQVSGVGELKASWYGKVFLERIRKYLDSQ